MIESMSLDEGRELGGWGTRAYRGLFYFKATLFCGVFGGGIGI